jgi:hypothetical protein
MAHGRRRYRQQARPQHAHSFAAARELKAVKMKISIEEMKAM